MNEDKKIAGYHRITRLSVKYGNAVWTKTIYEDPVFEPATALRFNSERFAQTPRLCKWKENCMG
jgi:hypothetical protein